MREHLITALTFKGLMSYFWNDKSAYLPCSQNTGGHCSTSDSQKASLFSRCTVGLLNYFVGGFGLNFLGREVYQAWALVRFLREYYNETTTE